MLIDTHTHLYSSEFDSDRTQIVKNALENGVGKMLLPNIDTESIKGMQSLVKQFPEHCYAMMGLHPGSVKEDWESQLAIIKECLFSGSYIAVGEIGIDLYWDKTFIKEQTEAFRRQVQWAKELNLPIVIHAREAFNEIFEVLDQEYVQGLKGIFHCFTGNLDQAKKALSYKGFKLGIGGVLTYKKAELDKVLEHIELENIVLETDSPYLPPVPFRGKRNESSYLVHIAEKLAEIYQCPLSEIKMITSNNAYNLFPAIK
ncbi:MAG: TatD family hydrolase [Flavobacteriia bacterium]|nr:TatD family hydrolase [Flavobacteriia bacterium]